MIGFEPTEEQALVVATVRAFAEKELSPVARECDEARRIPRALLERAHELGLVANALPAGVGGGGERSALTGVLVGGRVTLLVPATITNGKHSYAVAYSGATGIAPSSAEPVTFRVNNGARPGVPGGPGKPGGKAGVTAW